MLITDTNLASPDDFYEALIDTHRDLSLEQSQELNAALIRCWPTTWATWTYCARRCGRRARHARLSTPGPLPRHAATVLFARGLPSHRERIHDQAAQPRLPPSRS